jgi:hypothetical protein
MFGVAENPGNNIHMYFGCLSHKTGKKFTTSDFGDLMIL